MAMGENVNLYLLLIAFVLATQCYSEECRAGCLTGRSLQQKAHWMSLIQDVNQDLCAKACGDSFFTTFSMISDHGCFCSHHSELLNLEADACEHTFRHVDCDLSVSVHRPKSDHNLCPDPSRFYCQTKYKLEHRINDFMSYMTMEDKIKTMGQQSVSGKFRDKTPLVAREYLWWSESLHGVMPNHDPTAKCGEKCATQFPEANALSCSWNTTLWLSIASAISTEGRAYFNGHANNGLTFYAPQINLASHPLWGRVMETPGEDPYLTSVFAKVYIQGLQGDHPRVLKAAATPKHFIGHFMEGEHSDPWSNGTLVCRLSNDTRYSLQDLEQYYLPPFRAALKEAKAESLMCAYQSVNGVPMCGNGFLLNRVVRQEWNWTGFIVSDCDAVETMKNVSRDWDDLPFHAYSPDAVSAVQDAVRAGCDQNCGDTYGKYGIQALKDGRITGKQVDTSVYRQLRTLFRLGLFDPKEEDPFARLGWNHVGTRFHQELALEGARQSIVLLQNGNGTEVLPIQRDSRVLLAGPMYNATDALLGNYHGAACQDGTGSCLLSLDKALQVAQLQAIYGVPSGCKEDTSGIAEVVDAAAESDVVILVLGGICNEYEGQDRDFLHLPGSQMDLFHAVYQVGKPVAVVIINGGPFAIDDLKASSDIAIVQAGFPGQAGAQAIAEVLLGDVNPSGKLTATIYPISYANGKPMAGTPWVSSDLRPSDKSEGRSHMFYTGTPLFPFGYGLSYTTFEIEWETDPPALEWKAEELSDTGKYTGDFRIRISNTGTMAGRETVQAYWYPPPEVDSQLKRQLFAFQSSVLRPGESSVMKFSVRECMRSISTVTPFGDRVVMPGQYYVAFTRGHGKMLGTFLRALSYSLVRKFPSPWVENHEVVLDACVEGVQENIPHIERFLMAYKEWEWVPEKKWLMHHASKKCLTYHPPNNTTNTVNLQQCGKSPHYQQWSLEDGRLQTMTQPSLCLRPEAKTAYQVRSPVYLSMKCISEWTLNLSGLLQVRIATGHAAPAQKGLCLAARTEGRFNYQ